ncbi:MAG: NUDIX hydrolase [PVC group bacterium]|nr:NUDIX hydrolase [PVC group bacterium]
MKKISEKSLYQGTWINLKKSKFISDRGEEVLWEYVERVNVKQVVIIVPKLVPSNRYILIRQFRHALNTHVIGLPAGLIHDEEVSKAALRELKEETGYTGTIKEISPLLALNSALSNIRVQFVTAEIDENDPENKNPIQKLEPEEQIEVFLVQDTKAKDFIIEHKEKGDDVGASLWAIFGI